MRPPSTADNRMSMTRIINTALIHSIRQLAASGLLERQAAPLVAAITTDSYLRTLIIVLINDIKTLSDEVQININNKT
ncbi:hypothetical protein CEXT_706751 [Caerostris extrusa]|uniref:Uncharacterized protein n=1 Tax=Caerostris extrusa TaxID=172846 RepID=A0AAV4PXJ7_CAEEX|nr:hypothetical protein CEXT_706751 [Caerostris extrusa]